MDRLRRHGAILAGAFRLPLASLKAESRRVKRRYGIRDGDGNIKIRLRSIRRGELLKYSSLVDTLCHELAHLKHFNHGRRFWVFYERIRNYAQRRGIYRPGPERPITARVIEAPSPVWPLRSSVPPRSISPSDPESGSPPARNAARATPEPTQLELFPQ